MYAAAMLSSAASRSSWARPSTGGRIIQRKNNGSDHGKVTQPVGSTLSVRDGGAARLGRCVRRGHPTRPLSGRRDDRYDRCPRHGDSSRPLPVMPPPKRGLGRAFVQDPASLPAEEYGSAVRSCTRLRTAQMTALPCMWRYFPSSRVHATSETDRRRAARCRGNGRYLKSALGCLPCSFTRL